MVVTGTKKNGETLFQVEVNGEKTLLAILRENHIYQDAPCGGKGTCGKCKVRIRKGAGCPKQNEKDFFSDKELREGWRLSCCMRPAGDCEILLPDDLDGEMDVLADFSHTGKQTGTEAARELPFKEKGYGIAIDIGTTTLALVLVNLATGEREEVVTGVNHQRAYGADVIARMQASNEGAADELCACICSDLEGMMEQAVRLAGAAHGQIKKIAIAGNTAMCHLLLKYSCRTLGAAPFIPVDSSLQRKKSREIFAGSSFDADLIILPGISAFVGADITAGILSSGMAEKKEKSMLIDLGTNGEMVIGNRDGFLVTSAAAGPAFEGGNISCGMPGIAGAVTHVRMMETDGGYRIRHETIRGAEPAGLCGSGIIDVVCELVRHGLVDETGMLAEPWAKDGFPVAGREVVFTQSDIREIQMAKSAIRSGIETLMKEAAITPGAIKDVYIAGGFGYGIDVEKAIGIGIFPREFAGKAKLIGNSALEGAVRILLEEGAADLTERIVAMAKEVNLAMNGNFNEFYLQYMFFE